MAERFVQLYSEEDWTYWDDDSWHGQDWYDSSQDWSEDWSDWNLGAQPVFAATGSALSREVPNAGSPPLATQETAAVTIESTERSEERESLTPQLASNNPLLESPRRSSAAPKPVRPSLASRLFVGALMLIGTLSASVPPHPRSADDVIVDRMIGSHTPHDDSSSESSIEGQSELVPNPTGIGIDRLSDFHIQSGIVDRSWILFDSGASANCCPPWFASDYPLHPVGSDCPALRSISGKTLSILGKRIVELDCNGLVRAVLCL